MARVTVEWVRDGNIQWESWWVRRYGKTRNPGQPNKKDHLGFANFDLRRKGLPPLQTAADGTLFADVPSEKIEPMRDVIEYHGFRIERVS